MAELPVGGRSTLPVRKLHANRLPCSQDPETSRLLYDDPYRAQYGSHIQNIQRPIYQPDPESVKREREALDGICHAMSEYVTLPTLFGMEIHC